MKKLLLLCAALAIALACQAQARDAVVSWTAVGADSLLGTCDSVEVRYKTVPPAGTDTLTWWNNAARIVQRSPKAAGLPDSVVVAGLTSGQAYYFIAVAWDAAEPGYERSYYSNVAVLPAGDVMRPAKIGLGVRWK